MSRDTLDTQERLALMGQVVTVTAELVRKSDGPWLESGSMRSWVPKSIEPRAGWVVGFRSLQNGKYSAGGASYYGEPPHLYRITSVPCVLVAYWPTYNPVKVPLDGFEMGGKPHYTKAYFWDTELGKELRQDLSKDSKRWPRDEKGRWTA